MKERIGYAVFTCFIHKQMTKQEYNKGFSKEALLELAIDEAYVEDKFYSHADAVNYLNHCDKEYVITDYDDDEECMIANIYYLATVLINEDTEEIISVEDITDIAAEAVPQSVGFYGYDKHNNLVHW